MRLLVTRPDEDAKSLIAALKAQGHETVASPLLSIRFLPEAAIPRAAYRALLATSANGVRALGVHRDAALFHSLKVFAVGEASAEAACAAGFADVESAGGNVTALAALVARRLSPEEGPLLHVAGSTVAGDLMGDLEARGFRVTRVRLYEAIAASRLPEAARAAIEARTLDGALFYSPRTARTFAVFIRDVGLQDALSAVTAYCLSLAVAEALAGLPFAAVRIAEAPDQPSLLRLISG